VSLILTNGISVGVFGASGFTVGQNGTLASVGTPLTLNRIVRYQSVQEQPFVFGAAANGEIAVSAAGSPYGIMRFRFTDFPSVAGSTSLRTIVQVSTTIFQWFSLQDCLIRGADLTLNPWASGGSATIACTNNVFERCTVNLERYAANSACTLDLYNNDFWRGTVALTYESASGDSDPTSWNIYDNWFDNVSLTGTDNNSGSYWATYVVNAYNGYTGTTALPNGTHNQTLSSMAYQPGPLSPYYIPTNSALIDAGSRYATNAALYHFTTTTNQVIEGGTKVDIGAHWVGLSALGLPLDTDGDGLADYAEDLNGNGVYDSATETDWQTPNFGLAGTAAIQVYTPLK
jgi:hypothetical protein